MSKTALIWVFKLLGTLVISLILWATFIGTGATLNTLSAVDAVDKGTTVGPLYEQWLFRDDTYGFKAYLQNEWCYNSNYNGYWLSNVVSENWDDIDTTHDNVFILG